MDTEFLCFTELQTWKPFEVLWVYLLWQGLAKACRFS